MDIHFYGIIGSLVSSGMNTVSGSFAQLYSWIRTVVLENISPGMAVLFWSTILIPPAAWLYCSRVLIKGYREEITEVVASYYMTRDADQFYKDLRSMKYRPILRIDRYMYALHMSTALVYTGQPKKAMQSLNQIKNADREIRYMVRYQRKQILKEVSQNENL